MKNLPAMQETWVQILSWEYPLEEDIATHSSTRLKKSMDGEPWRVIVHQQGDIESNTSETSNHEQHTPLNDTNSIRLAIY